jgi:response regulator of citrate/malate metabolism
MRASNIETSRFFEKTLPVLDCLEPKSDPLDPAQKTARSCRVDIDIIGAAISQSTIQQPLDIGAVAYVTYVVNAHVVGIIPRTETSR